MDAYASYRERLVTAGSRRGRTVSLDWPLWESGGMRLDSEIEAMMRRSFGIAPMPTEAGLAAFAAGVASGAPAVLISSGDAGRIRSGLLEGPVMAAAEAIPAEEREQAVPDDLRTRAQDLLKGVLSTVLKLPPHRIDSDGPFDDYGIDSVTVMRLTGELEETFGPLPKTLFFEYLTIRELAGYFISAHAATLARLEGAGDALSSHAPATVVSRGDDSPRTPVHSRRTGRFARTIARGGPQTVDIAIIGASGTYPAAGGIDEFWANLAGGVDSITEIPAERWDWRDDFDPEKGKPGKTYAKWGGFIDGVDEFDPLFFGISPREARDPRPAGAAVPAVRVGHARRRRLHARVAAARDGGSRQGRDIGVYVGVMYEEYQLFGAQRQTQGLGISLTGNPSSVANRVATCSTCTGRPWRSTPCARRL